MSRVDSLAAVNDMFHAIVAAKGLQLSEGQKINKNAPSFKFCGWFYAGIYVFGFIFFIAVGGYLWSCGMYAWLDDAYFYFWVFV